MCGILAALNRTAGAAIDQDVFLQMLQTLTLRGPDGTNHYHDGAVSLGHTRLSIVDLQTGWQPIFNEDESVVCILNGEIYNFESLREQLLQRGHRFKTRSDTEVIVHLYEEKGEAVFEFLEGMFGIVIYDRKKQLLFVARDRMGEKPVYYYDGADMFLCASEVKALIKHPGINRALDPQALMAYMYSLYVPAQLSIFKDIRKLRPGHYLRVAADGIRVNAYWAPVISIDKHMSERQACETTLALLRQAVKKMLYSDVPLGVFLSGGIDSSAVTAMMASNEHATIKTFAVGFGDDINELPYARQVARRYGTDHTEIVIEPDIADELPRIAAYYDEPFADTSNIPTYLLCRETAKHVTVALSGDGGDELYAGYGSYTAHKYHLPNRFCTRAAQLLDRQFIRYTGVSPYESVYGLWTSNDRRGAWMRDRSFFSVREIETLLGQPFEPARQFMKPATGLNLDSRDPLSAAFEFDLQYYLPDDLLKKVDMAAMANSLETRAPFLDHHLVEFAMSIPPWLKVKGNEPKYVLKKALQDHLPREILYRGKQGFGSPIESWIRTGLSSMIREVLNPGAKIFDLLQRKQVEPIINNVVQGRMIHWKDAFKLWILLMLELWMAKYYV